MISKKAILASVATAVVLLTTVPVHGVTCNSVAESSNIETCPLQSSLNGTEVKFTTQSVVEDKTVKEERIYHYEKNRKYMAEVKTYYNTKADRTEAAKKLGVDSEKSSVSNMLNYNLYEEDGLYVLEVQIPSAYAAVDGIDKTYKLALEQKVFRTTLKGSTKIGDNCELITKFILPYDIVDSNCEYEGNTVIIKGTEGVNIWAIGFKTDTSSSIKASGIKDGCVKRDGTGQFNIKVTCDNDIFTSSKLYIKDNTR